MRFNYSKIEVEQNRQFHNLDKFKLIFFYFSNFKMDQADSLDYIGNHQTYEGLCHLPFQGRFVIMLSQQQYPNLQQQQSDHHSHLCVPLSEEPSSDVTRQLKITYVGIAFNQSTLLRNQPSEHPVNCQIKKEKQCDPEPEPDNKSYCDRDSVFVDESIEVANSQRSTETENKDPVGDEINDKIATFIQLLMTDRQSDKSFRSLYDNTHHPANVPALGEMRLRSMVRTEGSEIEGRIEYTQNCVLKGVTKTAYVMDNLFKHVDKLPKEMQPQQLISDPNSAMKFFGAANLEFNQMSTEIQKQYMKTKIGHNNPLMTQEAAVRIESTRTTEIPSKISIQGTRGSTGRSKSRFHPYCD